MFAGFIFNGIERSHSGCLLGSSAWWDGWALLSDRNQLWYWLWSSLYLCCSIECWIGNDLDPVLCSICDSIPWPAGGIRVSCSFWSMLPEACRGLICLCYCHDDMMMFRKFWLSIFRTLWFWCSINIYNLWISARRFIASIKRIELIDWFVIGLLCTLQDYFTLIMVLRLRLEKSLLSTLAQEHWHLHFFQENQQSRWHCVWRE